jgi:hypothetical protein
MLVFLDSMLPFIIYSPPRIPADFGRRFHYNRGGGVFQPAASVLFTNASRQ